MFKVYEVRERPMRDTLATEKAFGSPDEAVEFLCERHKKQMLLDVETAEDGADIAFGIAGQITLYRVEKES